MSKPINVEISAEITAKIPKSRNCFERAYQAALLLKEASYTQGFLVLPTKPYRPIEYSWLELEESIIDPTPRHFNDFATNLYYFPAQSLSLKQLKSAIEEAKEDYPDDPPLPVYGNAPYEYYGEVMLGGKAYQTAYEQALAKCQELQKLSTNGSKPSIHTSDFNNNGQKP